MSAQAEQFGVALVRKNRQILFPSRQKLTFDNTLSIQTVRGTVCTHVHFRLTQENLVIFTNVGVQIYNVHIVDFLHMLNSLICFSSFGSTPVQDIAKIYWRNLHIRVRAKFIFKARIFTQQLSNLTPQERNILITSVFGFLQPLLSLLKPSSPKFPRSYQWDCVDCATKANHAKNTLDTQRLHLFLRSTLQISN